MLLAKDGEGSSLVSSAAIAVPADLNLNSVEQMMYRDTLTYLPDDIMWKVDRAAMATSLMTRAPYLHPDVIAMAWRLPLEAKMKGQIGKAPLRKILFRHVPASL